MGDVVLLLLAALSCHSGAVWLALAIRAHWRQVTGESAPDAATVRMLRILGAAALLVGLVLCLWADAPSMAVLVWIMYLALFAFITAFTLAWRPQVLKLWLPGFRPRSPLS